MTDWAEDWIFQVWRDPKWLACLNEIDREPPKGETPTQTYRRRHAAIIKMREIETHYVTAGKEEGAK